jgi:plasmid stabilization system protein ParE
VPRLVYRKTARRNLAEIADFIERQSRDRAAAKAIIDKLVRYCEHLAQLPFVLGRPRPELGPGYRSTTCGSYAS